jgi:hypothetical protein
MNHRALAFGELERRAHRLERQEDVGEEDRRVHPEPEGLARHLERELDHERNRLVLGAPVPRPRINLHLSVRLLKELNNGLDEVAAACFLGCERGREKMTRMRVDEKPDLPLRKVAEKADSVKNGLMFRKDRKELVSAVNKALADMRSDGTYLKISEKFFGADVSQ